MALRAGIFYVLLVFISFQLVRVGNAVTHYANTWAVHIPNVEPEKVNEIARRHGMINLGQVE